MTSIISSTRAPRREGPSSASEQRHRRRRAHRHIWRHAKFARYRRRPELARAALLAQLERFPRSARSLDAVFLLGRVEELRAEGKQRALRRYDEYLAKGWPIASGPVEGACKNLIKDRMERSGMRWTPAMAEAVVKLRAIFISGDFDGYWEFHIQQDQQRLYPVRWAVVPK